VDEGQTEGSKTERDDQKNHLTLASTSPSCRWTYEGTRVKGTTNVTYVLKGSELGQQRIMRRGRSKDITEAEILHCVEDTKS
jgi:hypothetical protein